MPFIFPLNVEGFAGTEDDGLDEPPLEIFWTVDESSIKINPWLDEDLFTISPSRAKTVFDLDKALEDGTLLPSFDIADDGRIIVHEPFSKEPWSTPRILFFVIGNLAVLGLLIYLLLWRGK